MATTSGERSPILFYIQSPCSKPLKSTNKKQQKEDQNEQGGIEYSLQLKTPQKQRQTQITMLSQSQKWSKSRQEKTAQINRRSRSKNMSKFQGIKPQQILFDGFVQIEQKINNRKRLTSLQRCFQESQTRKSKKVPNFYQNFTERSSNFIQEISEYQKRLSLSKREKQPNSIIVTTPRKGTKRKSQYNMASQPQPQPQPEPNINNVIESQKVNYCQKKKDQKHPNPNPNPNLKDRQHLINKIVHDKLKNSAKHLSNKEIYTKLKYYSMIEQQQQLLDSLTMNGLKAKVKSIWKKLKQSQNQVQKLQKLQYELMNKYLLHKMRQSFAYKKIIREKRYQENLMI